LPKKYLGRSKRGKGREPSGSSPECSESGNNRRSRRISTLTGSLCALHDCIFPQTHLLDCGYYTSKREENQVNNAKLRGKFDIADVRRYND